MATPARGLVPVLLAFAVVSCGPGTEPGRERSESRSRSSASIEEPIFPRGWVFTDETPSSDGGNDVTCCDVPVVILDEPAAEVPAKEAPSSVDEACCGPRDWLALHQAADGRWSAEGMAVCGRRPCEEPGNVGHVTGRTALALLAYLERGATHKSKAAVRAGLKHLKSIQDAEGCFGSREEPGFVQDHALATFAMAKVLGDTGSPLFKCPAQSGVEYLQSLRTPDGGWRASPWDRQDDLLLTAWAVAALKEAKRAGLDVDVAAFDGALAFVTRTEVAPGEESAASLWIRWCGGQDLDHPEFSRIAADLLDRRPRKGEAAGPRLVEWYFTKLVMFELRGSPDGDPERTWWKAWSAELAAAISPAVRGPDAGCADQSLDPLPGEFGTAYGRVGATALHDLVLQAVYRCFR